MYLFGQTLSSTTSVFDGMNNNATSYLSKRRTKYNPIQIESQVPFWMIKNGDGYGNPSTMIYFLQYYYEWLAEKYGYETGNIFEITKLFDVSETPSYILPHMVNVYAPDIKGIYNLDESERPSDSAIRNTIYSIKTELYENKSTEVAYHRLMGSLFSIDPDSITIKYPKRRLMRLNGGLLPWMSTGVNSESAGFVGSTGEYSNERFSLVGSYLNSSVLQDGNLWQEYSYVIDSEIDDTNPYYVDVIKETLHPAGLLAFFEQNERYAEESDPTENQFFDYESPVIANYYPYGVTSTETLPPCTGCTGERSEPGWSHPTFVFPNWDQKIKARNVAIFGDIQVLNEFVNLKSEPNKFSPNDIIGTECEYTCNYVGGVSFYGLCGGLLAQPFNGITMALVESEIKFFNDSDFGFNSFEWDFGDNTTITETNTDFNIPSTLHTYSNQGLYNVRMIGSKVNGYTASWGLTMDVGSLAKDILGCFDCMVYNGALHAKKNINVGILRVPFNGPNPGSQPFTYTWSFEDGSSTGVSSNQTQKTTFTKVGIKSVGLTLTNRFGSVKLNMNVNVVSQPEFGISGNYGDPYLLRYLGYQFTSVGITLNNHKIEEIDYEWQINSQYHINTRNFQYIFDTNGTYDVGLSYSSLIYPELRGFTSIEVYVGEAPSIPTFTRTPSGDVYVLQGITFEGTN